MEIFKNDVIRRILKIWVTIKERFLGKEAEEAITKDKKSFRVGDVFQQQKENCVPQNHGHRFVSWLLGPAKDRNIPINTDHRRLVENVLDRRMNDSVVRSETKFTPPMSEEAFWLVLYLLIIDPELGKKVLGYELQKGKWYFLYMKFTAGQVIAVDFGWRGGEWRFFAHNIDHGRYWARGDTFLFLLTV